MINRFNYKVKQFTYRKTNPNDSHDYCLQCIINGDSKVFVFWMRVINYWIKKYEEYSLFELIYFFDDIEIYGSNTIDFFDDVCGNKIENIIIIIDAYKLGYITRDNIYEGYAQKYIDIEKLREKINNYPHNPEDQDNDW